MHAVRSVGGDDVVGPDGDLLHAVEELDAVLAVGNGARAGGIGTDVVTQDGDVSGPGVRLPLGL